MKIVVFAFSFALVLPFLAEAQPVPPAPAAKVCLRQDMVRGWKVIDDKTLIVTDRVNKQFTVSLMPGCHDLKFNDRLGFKSFGGIGLSCLGHNDYVLVPPGGGLPSQRCFISDIQGYSATTPLAGAAAASPPK